jgi:hypothetical protein
MKVIRNKKELGVSIIILLVLLVFTSDGFSKGYKEGTKESTQTIELSPEQKYSKWVEDQFRRDGSNEKLIATVKKGLKNPDSFKHVETRHIMGEGYITIEMTYRATNSFNAIITEKVIAMIDYKTNEVTIISKE